jgi:hypothetical protein
MGLLGALHPCTTWSTFLPHASHIVPLCLSSGVTVHLSRWPHVLRSTPSRLLHLELRSLLGQVSHASTMGVLGTSLESVPSLIRATLLGAHHRLAVSKKQ